MIQGLELLGFLGSWTLGLLDAWILGVLRMLEMMGISIKMFSPGGINVTMIVFIVIRLVTNDQLLVTRYKSLGIKVLRKLIIGSSQVSKEVAIA